jgi:hypothetical protein
VLGKIQLATEISKSGSFEQNFYGLPFLPDIAKKHELRQG